MTDPKLTIVVLRWMNDDTKIFSKIKNFQESTKMTNFHVKLWFLGMTTKQQFLKAVLEQSKSILKILEKFEFRKVELELFENFEKSTRKVDFLEMSDFRDFFSKTPFKDWSSLKSGFFNNLLRKSSQNVNIGF